MPLFTSALIVALNLLFIAHSAENLPPSAAGDTFPQGPLMEDKMRLGSIPPSCHNRCMDCSPCTAVQVPTLPSRGDVEKGVGSAKVGVPLDLSSYNKYSNYKPLGWKCRCGDHLFNP
ncbi:EPIDERMAL PATTERNING FACTOR-like protein 1 [Acorus gramineus]|uniref:Epidermal patterning factor-like protein n=1 Tax=Acorus gramineus TaxID=55184 RepID=A0AAV9AFT9_ACOGR|nr:EPIDERMAL PATTERNING FACTOR-like protein 1 [Acorus gramineus]